MRITNGSSKDGRSKCEAEQRTNDAKALASLQVEKA